MVLKGFFSFLKFPAAIQVYSLVSLSYVYHRNIRGGGGGRTSRVEKHQIVM